MSNARIDLGVIRRTISRLIVALYLVYALARKMFTDFELGASGHPLWIDVALGMVMAYGIYRWDQQMLMELGGEKFVPTFGRAFELLGIVLGIVLLMTGVTAIYLFDSPPHQ